MEVGLELVVGRQRIPVYAWSDRPVPQALRDFALPLNEAHAIVAAVQAGLAELDEAKLREKALALCRANEAIRLKDYRARRLQTLFGDVRVRIPRLLARHNRDHVHLLADDAEASDGSAERILARLGAWMSYRYAARFLAELFPLACGCNPERVRRATLSEGAAAAMPQRDSDGRSSDHFNLCLDTAFLRSHDRAFGRHHEVLIGNVRSDNGGRRVIGTVFGSQTDPPDHLTACLESIGRTDRTQMTCFTDGDKLLRGLLKACGIRERPMLDWEHVARKLQNLKIIARGIRPGRRSELTLKTKIAATLEQLNWRLWHGQLQPGLKALSQIERLAWRLRSIKSRVRLSPKVASLLNGIGRLRDYINGQSAYIVDYAARHRAGLPIGTSQTESLANSLINKRMNKSQQMRWSKAGAQAVISLRVAHINEMLRSNSNASTPLSPPPVL